MSGHTQRSQSTGNPTKSKASHKAKRKETAPGKQTPTQKKAPNDTDTGSYDEGGAVTTDRPSSLFRLASPTGEAQQLATRFSPLIASISLFSDRSPHSRAPYGLVKTVMIFNRKQEMENLGWSSFEQLLAAAFQAKVVQKITVNGNQFLKLPPPPPPPPTPMIPGPLLPQTTHSTTAPSPGAGKTVLELVNALKRSFPRLDGDWVVTRAAQCDVLRIRRSSPEVAWVYLNPPTTRTDNVPQPATIPTRSQSPQPPLQRDAQKLVQKHVPPCVKRPSETSNPVESPPPPPPRKPVQPTTAPPQSASGPTSDASRRLTSVLNRLAPVGFVDVDEVVCLLRLEYPWAKDDFLLSIIKNAEEEDIEVWGRKRNRESAGLASMEGPRALDTSPSPRDQAKKVDHNRMSEPNPVPAVSAAPKSNTSTQSAPSSAAKVVSGALDHGKPKPASMGPKTARTFPPGPSRDIVQRPTAPELIPVKDVNPNKPKPITHFKSKKPDYSRVPEHRRMPKSGGGWWH